MKLSGDTASDNRNKLIAVGAFVAIAGGVLYYELFSGGTTSTSAPAPAAVSAPESSPAPAAEPRVITAGAAKTVGTTAAALDPTLHMNAMLVSESVEYAGSGRNIFSAASAPPPVVIQKPIAPARLTAAVVPAGPPPPPPGPPPPPPIDLKFFGTETAADGTRLAFLLHNDDVLTASTGDVVMRRYKVVSIEAKTIHVEDMQYNNTQTLPLLSN